MMKNPSASNLKLVLPEDLASLSTLLLDFSEGKPCIMDEHCDFVLKDTWAVTLLTKIFKLSDAVGVELVKRLIRYRPELVFRPFLFQVTLASFLAARYNQNELDRRLIKPMVIDELNYHLSIVDSGVELHSYKQSGLIAYLMALYINVETNDEEGCARIKGSLKRAVELKAKGSDGSFVTKLRFLKVASDALYATMDIGEIDTQHNRKLDTYIDFTLSHNNSEQLIAICPPGAYWLYSLYTKAVKSRDGRSALIASIP